MFLYANTDVLTETKEEERRVVPKKVELEQKYTEKNEVGTNNNTFISKREVTTEEYLSKTLNRPIISKMPHLMLSFF